MEKLGKISSIYPHCDRTINVLASLGCEAVGPLYLSLSQAHVTQFSFSLVSRLFKITLRLPNFPRNRGKIPSHSFSPMEFASVHPICLHVSQFLQSLTRNLKFLHRSQSISDIYCLQLISSAIQRCRLSEALCRLSVVLKRSPNSDPLLLRISSNSLSLSQFDFTLSIVINLQNRS